MKSTNDSERLLLDAFIQHRPLSESEIETLSYYSDSAIRERCVKMVIERRNTNTSYIYTPITVAAEELFQYIKDGIIRPDEDRKSEC